MNFRQVEEPNWPRDEANIEILAYIDDSGLGQPPISILAGFIGTPSQWRRFGEKWDAELKTHPSLNRFRLKEAVLNLGEFRGTETNTSIARAEIFHAIFDEVGLVPIGIGCNPSVFKSIKKVLPKKAYRSTLYFSLATGLITHTCDYLCDLGLTPKVRFTFDEQSRLGPRLADEDREACKSNDFRLRNMIKPPIRFADDKECHPLQAADAIAWSYRRQMDARLGGKEKPNLLFDVDRLKPNGMKGAGFFAAYTQKQLARATNEILRVQGYKIGIGIR